MFDLLLMPSDQPASAAPLLVTNEAPDRLIGRCYSSLHTYLASERLILSVQDDYEE